MLKLLRKLVTNNLYLLIGAAIGLYISNFVLYLENCNTPSDHLISNAAVNLETGRSLKNTQFNFTQKTSTTPSSGKKQKLIRPRYYSTELGIREKLFVGIFTSESKVNTQAIHINKTIGHLVDRIKFFITAQHKMKSKFNLTGLVGFTDTRQRYRPFQVFKYMEDNFGQEYDYYFLSNDFTYVNILSVKDVLRKISVSADIYFGTKVHDTSYCDLNAGLILSNSVLKAIREHLDWCVINSVSDNHSENIGRCVHHSTGLTCQDTIQDQKFHSYNLKRFDLSSEIEDLSKRIEFNRSLTVYPILQKKDFFLLNGFFLKQRLYSIKDSIDLLRKQVDVTWPPGHKNRVKPATRFDLPREYSFNMTHVFFSDDFTNVRPHTEPELLDVKNIIQRIVSREIKKNDYLVYKNLVNGYKTFDLSRGIDYIFDLDFYNVNTGASAIKRFEVCRPLGKVEFIPVPYVTENTRVNILLPIQETELEVAKQFLNDHSNILTDKKEKSFLMLILLYQNQTSNKGKDDIFADLKNVVTKLINKSKNSDVKLSWLSVRLPSGNFVTFDNNWALNFAVIDLALQKIGLDSLVLVLDGYCSITRDFLNRVRMNTIENHQVFTPIPFRQYDPRISQTTNIDVNKNAGHFDREEYRYVSFYARDYVLARKKLQSVVPIIRTDYDLANILDRMPNTKWNVFEMFLKYANHLHCMRATESNLIVKYHEVMGEERVNKFLGTDAQLAKFLLQSNQISEIK